MSYIEEALAKARELAKKAKSQRPEEPRAGGLSDVGNSRALLGAAPGGALASYGASRGGGGGAPHQRAQAEGRRLFIGGLSYDTTDQSLEEYFNRQWQVEEGKVKYDNEGRSRGFGFVVFPTVSLLEDAFEYGDHWIDGKKVSLRKVNPDGTQGQAARGAVGMVGGRWDPEKNGPGRTSTALALTNGGSSSALAIPGQKRSISMGMTRYNGGGGPDVTRVYIGSAPSDTSRYRGLDDSIDDEDLRAFFSQFGTVTGVAQHRWEDTGRKKGYGYLEFDEFEAAEAAMGYHTINGKQLEVKSYTQGGVRTPAEPAGGAPGGPGYGYGPAWAEGGAKRQKTDGPPPLPSGPYPNLERTCFDFQQGKCTRGERCTYRHVERAKPEAAAPAVPADPQAMMAQMHSMMQQMKQMQEQMAGGGMAAQMAAMQQTMYGMMQSQYYGAAAAYGSAGYQYPQAGIEYPGYGSQAASQGSQGSQGQESQPKPPGDHS